MLDLLGAPKLKIYSEPWHKTEFGFTFALQSKSKKTKKTVKNKDQIEKKDGQLLP